MLPALCYLRPPKRQFKTHAYLFANTDEDGTNLKLSTALIGLAVITGLVAWLSEFLVDAIDGFTEEVCTYASAFFVWSYYVVAMKPESGEDRAGVVDRCCSNVL